MSGKFKYEFDQKTGVLYKFYYGLITIKDIKFSWEYAFANNLIPENVKGFILDYRDATFSIDYYEHLQIAEFYQNHIEVFRNLKIAIITDNPKDVVIPVLVKVKDKDYISKPFSTLNAAMNWVLA